VQFLTVIFGNDEGMAPREGVNVQERIGKFCLEELVTWDLPFDDLTEDTGCERPGRVKFAIAMIMLCNVAADEMPYLTADAISGSDMYCS